jgi:Domain of Unknown Function (DUF1206)
MPSNHSVRKPRAAAESGRGWYAWLARSGLVAKGVSFAIVGLLAIKLAVGDGGKSTSREGALKTLAQHGWGDVLLVLLAVGFAAYAMWRFVQAFAERDDEGGEKGAAKTWGKRGGYVGRGLIYAALAISAVKLLAGSEQEQSQNERAHHAAGTMLGWPGGRLLVGAAGLVIIGVGLWNLYRGVTRKFEDKWRTGEMSSTERTWGARIGTAGHISRFVVFGLIGVFVIKAAIDYAPRNAIGIDGALQKLSQASYGPYLLGLTAFGLVCYGVYCFVDARYRDVSANSGRSRDGGVRRRTTPAVDAASR